MGQAIRKHKGKVFNYSPNNTVSEDLSLGMIYRWIQFGIEGQLECAAADNTTANTKLGDELALIKRIKLIRNNTTVIRNIRGPQLKPFQYHAPQTGNRYPLVSPELGDGNADPNFETYFRIPLESVWTGQPADTWLDSGKLQNLSVEIEWGDHTDINSNATGFVNAPTAKVEKKSMSSGFDPEGGFDRRRVLEKRKTVDSTTDNFQVEFPVGGDVYAGWYIRQIADGADQPGVLKNFKVTSGGTIFANVDVPAHSEDYREHYNVRQPDRQPRSDDFDFDAHVPYIHGTDGRLSEALATRQLSELVLECDVDAGVGTNVELQFLALRYQLGNPAIAESGGQ